jgi:hypothetical protein
MALPQQAYSVGMYVDCMDESSKFLMAEVTEVYQNSIKVHFHGWGTRYDKVFPLRVDHGQP